MLSSRRLFSPSLPTSSGPVKLIPFVKETEVARYQAALFMCRVCGQASRHRAGLSVPPPPPRSNSATTSNFKPFGFKLLKAAYRPGIKTQGKQVPCLSFSTSRWLHVVCLAQVSQNRFLHFTEVEKLDNFETLVDFVSITCLVSI